MIKVFTVNKNNKIELTKQELQKLLDESYWDGYAFANGEKWTYTSPSVVTTPYSITVTNADINSIGETKNEI